MAANATTSPLASIKHGAANVAPQLEYVAEYVSNASAWTILATVLAILVAYDQRMWTVQNSTRSSQAMLTCRPPSRLYLEQGIDRRPGLEAAVYWAFPSVGESQVRGVPCKVVERPSQLRLGVPQVSKLEPVAAGG